MQNYTDEEIAPALPPPEEQRPTSVGSGSTDFDQDGSQAGSAMMVRVSTKNGSQKTTVGKRLRNLGRRVDGLEAVEAEREMEQLPQDTNSVLMSTSSQWISILFALSISATQLFIYFVLLFNSPLSKSNPEDSFPMGVTATIRAAQVIAVFITVYTQQDTVDALLLWKSGFDSVSSYHEVDDKTPVIGQRWKYHLCLWLRFGVGLTGMAATWVLIAGSDEAVDLLLNFTAVEFVASLDGSAFELMLHGFVGDALQKDAKTVESVRYSINDENKYKWRRYLLLIFLLLMLGALTSLAVRQGNRKVGDNEVYVQFDDAVVPELSSHSGLYEGNWLFGIFLGTNGAIVYERKGASWPAPFFGYCMDSKQWIFFFDPADLPSSRSKLKDMKFCHDKTSIVHSNKDGSETKRSDEFDLLTHRGAQWLFQGKERINEVSLILVPAQQMKGTYELVKKRQESTCGRAVQLSGEGGGQTFELVTLPENTQFFANRPRYKYNDTLILFNGYRWIYATGINGTDVSVEDLKANQVKRISEPVKYLSEKDSFFPSADLTWYKALDSIRPDSTQSGKDSTTAIQCNLQCNEDSEVKWSIEIITDDYPSETYFAAFNDELLADSRNILNATHISIVKKKETTSFTFPETAGIDVLQGGPFDANRPQSSYTYQACANKSIASTIVIRDDYGDGFEGTYRLFLNGADALSQLNMTDDWKYCMALSLDLPNYSPSGTNMDIVKPTKCSLEMIGISQDAELAGNGNGNGDIGFTCEELSFDDAFCSELDQYGESCEVCSICSECPSVCLGCNVTDTVVQSGCNSCIEESPTSPSSPASPVAPASSQPTLSPMA